MRILTLLLGAVFVVALHGTSFGAIDFVDWTLVDTNNDIAQGTVCLIGVTMTGPDLTFGVTDGSYTIFNNAIFCPPLASSDVVEFAGTSPAYSYTVTFGAPVTDPVLHIASLASTLVFSGVTLTKLCGQAAFVVAGNQITGDCVDGSQPNDTNGTVKVNGVVSSLSFTAYWEGCQGFTRDGVHIQIGVECSLPTESGTWGRVKALYR
jgi:hypothetical protein